LLKYILFCFKNTIEHDVLCLNVQMTQPDILPPFIALFRCTCIKTDNSQFEGGDNHTAEWETRPPITNYLP